MPKGNWIKVSDRLPPENKIVKTKVHKYGMVSNESKLVRKGSLWWLPNKSIFVYFTPTHWLDE